jgi:hypothetical protein
MFMLSSGLFTGSDPGGGVEKKKTITRRLLVEQYERDITRTSAIKFIYKQGADPGFKVRGGALKKIAPSGWRRENCCPCEFYSHVEQTCMITLFHKEGVYIQGRTQRGAHPARAPPP